jgi:hypothetical protein
LVLACLVVLGAFWASRGFHSNVSDLRSPTPSPTGVPTADAPVVFSGVGSQDTQSFHLAGGTYRTVWSAWGEAAEFPPCTHSVELLVIDPNRSASLGAHVTDLAKLVSVPATGASEERYLANAEPGSYYLHITSACSWQVALSSN